MDGYGQFCPVAKAAEVVCRRWTPLVLRELLLGSRRFNDIRRGVPLMSSALLTKRLRELEDAGVVVRTEADGRVLYDVTEAGRELYPIVQGLGEWGQRWVRSEYGPDELDPALLLWDVRRFLQPDGLGVERTVVEFHFPDAPSAKRRFWVVVDRDAVGLCFTDPGFPVEVAIESSVRALTEVWMGDTSFERELAARRIRVDGPEALTNRVPAWFGQHPVLAPVAPAVPRRGSAQGRRKERSTAVTSSST